MRNRKNQAGFAAIIVVAALAGILVLGSVGIAGAANNAVPGDSLYPLDTGIEALRLGLTNDPQSQIDLRTQFVAERLGEAQQVLQQQGAGAVGIDIALANLTDHRSQIATLISQNQELQARVKALESQLQQNQSGLNSAFDTAEENLENLLDQAIAAGDTAEAGRLRAQLDNLDVQQEAFEDEDEDEEEIEEEEEPEETPEPEEAPESEEEEEATEANETSESEESEVSEN